MRQRPRKSEIDKLKAIFHGRTLTEHNESPNGLAFISEEGENRSFIKVVSKDLAKEAGLENVETRLKDIASENIVKLISYGDIDEHYQYLEFEAINGDDLESFTTPASEKQVEKLIREIGSAISELWKAGIVHRDIKPGNIMYDVDNDRFVLVDLGIGYFIEDAHRDNTKFGPGAGSRYYSSPEQIWANSNLQYSITFASDLFSLGLVSYELASNLHPFKPTKGSKIKNYADAVTGSSVVVDLDQFHVSEHLSNVIMKMISLYPADRHVSMEAFFSHLDGVRLPPYTTDADIYLHMPSEGTEGFLEYLQDNTTANPDAVVLNCSNSDDWAEKITDCGVEVIFDPQTYKLQTNKNMANVQTKLSLPRSPQYNVLDIYEHIDHMINKVIATPINNYSTKIVLPYFNVEEAGGSYIKLMREKIWSKASEIRSSHLELEHKELYAGILIPKSFIINEKPRSELLSQFQDKYDLDGVYVIFESPSSSIATVVDVDYLKGVKTILASLRQTFGKVIVSKSDIALLPFIQEGGFATGWSKSSRHVVLNSQGRRTPYKMKLFSKDLFTFIEEQSNIQIIVRSGFSDMLKCEPCFTEGLHLVASYIPNEKKESRHFYTDIISLVNGAKGLDGDDYREYYLTTVSNARDNGRIVKAGTAGLISNQIVPDYEGLISVISQ